MFTSLGATVGVRHHYREETSGSFSFHRVHHKKGAAFGEKVGGTSHLQHPNTQGVAVLQQ